MRFTLMNADRPLLIFDFWPDRHLELIELLVPKASVPDRVKSAVWLAARLSPSGRDEVLRVLDALGLSTPLAFLENTHAVSYTDTLWANPFSRPTTWANVSPYTNNFSRILSDALLHNGVARNKFIKTPSPDYTVGGAISKAWVRRDGMVYLAKTAGKLVQEGDYGVLSGLNPFSDFYAAQFFEALCGELKTPRLAIPYSLGVSSGVPVSYCPAFTSEREGLAEYHEVATEPLEDAIFRREAYADWLTMLLADSIVLNRDRHEGNYGFIMDNSTLRIKRLAPVYDFDNSLGKNVPVYDNELECAYEAAMESQPTTFHHLGFTGQGKKVLTDKTRVALKNLYPFRLRRSGVAIDVSDTRLRFIEYIINRQIKSILGK